MGGREAYTDIWWGNLKERYHMVDPGVDGRILRWGLSYGPVHHNSMLIKIEPDATVCRYLFTAKSLYMFRVSQYPSSGVLKLLTAASGTGHNIGTATSRSGHVGGK